MEHNAGINVNSQFLELCGITASADSSGSSSSSIWHSNQTGSGDDDKDARERFASVNSLLRDYVTVFSPTDEVAGLPPRARIDAILIMSLGLAKQKLLRSLSAATQAVASDDAEERLETLFWGHDQVISVPVPLVNPCNIRISVLDYVLWYGDTGGLETNLIVLRMDEALGGMVEEEGQEYYFAALAAICQSLLVIHLGSLTGGIYPNKVLAMIHHNRTKQDIIQDTCGIVTDGLKWIFLHVNKKHECSSIEFNWLAGETQAIVPLIGKIMDHAVKVKMMCEESELIKLGLSLEWKKMATMWNSPQQCNYSNNSEVEEMESLNSQDHSIQHSTSYLTIKMDWLADLKEGFKDLLHRAKRGEGVEQRFEELFKSASVKRNQELSSKQRKGIESLAVTDIDPNDLMKLFDLQREARPTSHWRVAPWEVLTVSSHLAVTLEQIKLVYGRAEQNEAVIRLTIDAIFLDLLANLKTEFGQYEEGKGKGKRPSTESTLSRKSLQMALETYISYIYPTRQSEGIVDELIHGRIDYSLWYGKPEEAETNLLVVEVKHKNFLAAGRYQAISYMALIQHARYKARRAKTPIYGVATDSQDWDFIRMDATGNVDIQQFSWEANQRSQIISLLHKIVAEASTLSPVPSREMTRERTVEELTGIRLTKSDGSPA
ncbi:hypothetical protein BJY01DRAFT_246503 [Aspergillus pseudoustus]|uniref:Uncharacterized protein n=1 Tax=Aspergillus pseudoustus TaxID=1810923 RepID=A0ABR4K797_9EURO